PHSVIQQVNSDRNVFSDVVRAQNDTFYNWYPGTFDRFRLDATAHMRTLFPLPDDDSSSLYLSVADVGDADGDTAVAIDSITFFPEYQCAGLDLVTETARTFAGPMDG